jgi:hypothetical protein
MPPSRHRLLRLVFSLCSSCLSLELGITKVGFHLGKTQLESDRTPGLRYLGHCTHRDWHLARGLGRLHWHDTGTGKELESHLQVCCAYTGYRSPTLTRSSLTKQRTHKHKRNKDVGHF